MVQQVCAACRVLLVRNLVHGQKALFAEESAARSKSGGSFDDAAQEIVLLDIQNQVGLRCVNACKIS